MEHPELVQVATLAVATLVFYFFLRKIFVRVPSTLTTRTPENPTGIPLISPHPRNVSVHKFDPNLIAAETDIDIIAIHGLDTKSPDTWTWRDPKHPTNPGVNWLADKDMLPEALGKACIFHCDWPADLFESTEFAPKHIEELARLLLAGLQRRHSSSASNAKLEDRPVVFIASCLGGIILMKALTMAEKEFKSVQKATKGVVFLATPFSGTSFAGIASWAGLCLEALGLVKRQRVSQLLSNLKGPTFALGELVTSFTSLSEVLGIKGQVFTFYESGKTDLLRGKVSWIPRFLSNPQVLVNRSSGTLQFVQNPLPLDRRHLLMNKFSGPDDPGYILVHQKIREIVRSIQQGTPIQQADAAIRRWYSKERLRIERLSGGLLPMEQCYINLAIVKQSSDHANRPSEATAEAPSPFSLNSRLNITQPVETLQVTLPELFDPRPTGDKEKKPPRRILIRGRAGMGKTTLCKKIVHDFTHHQDSPHGRMWSNMFDRVLWVPLRNLKQSDRCQIAGYSFQHLYTHEYFSESPDLSHALVDELDKTECAKTLFLLDGWDEVATDLKGDMSKFILQLLNQQNIILTSRPHARLPSAIHRLDLELETIGFYPEQVGSYLRASGLDSGSIADIQSFLQRHQLMQGLVRIPIQLDALCYIWNNGDAKTHVTEALQTMTAVYTAIWESLLRKDVVNVGKFDKNEAEETDAYVIRREMEDTLQFLEALAFAGMYSDQIEFGPRDREIICEYFRNKVPLEAKELAKVAKLSFLRPSDPSLKPPEQHYHFIHLTFQEYFAARYFARQWKQGQQLECVALKTKKCVNTKPVNFFQKHKYDMRYNIVWRFVTGLLNDIDGGELVRFFEAIEQRPRDLLGPAHQRLLMHTLNEAPHKRLELYRDNLEEELTKLLLVEYKHRSYSLLAREPEFPIRILEKFVIQNKGPPGLDVAILKCLRYRYSRLSDAMLESIAARFKDEDWHVRTAAVNVLGKQATLSDAMLESIAARLEHENSDVREAAVDVLGKQATLSDAILESIAARFKDEDWPVREAAVDVLGKQATLSDAMLEFIAARLEHENSDVREAAVNVLGKQATLSDAILESIAARLEDENSDVRKAAVNVLTNRSFLCDAVTNRYNGPFQNELRLRSFDEHIVWLDTNGYAHLIVGFKVIGT
ncbi:uncharacterized protein PpBr36_10322 [Pyricularia pennisetigena]|uniref:uncharacterized protein n=1 Tax=Pyricularia pennisetigena TaxID=1578925 RepID=UPI00114F63AC|nr:uncharacterized protein PpBr36_10322 [Pyricularia pennisetigena]TLS21304.1 hypothetical protein PpBr36_10322 [Pyricularia pennisetigena]